MGNSSSIIECVFLAIAQLDHPRPHKAVSPARANDLFYKTMAAVLSFVVPITRDGPTQQSQKKEKIKSWVRTLPFENLAVLQCDNLPHDLTANLAHHVCRCKNSNRVSNVGNKIASGVVFGHDFSFVSSLITHRVFSANFWRKKEKSVLRTLFLNCKLILRRRYYVYAFHE
jgi:hypothetical protein